MVLPLAPSLFVPSRDSSVSAGSPSLVFGSPASGSSITLFTDTKPKSSMTREDIRYVCVRKKEKKDYVQSRIDLELTFEDTCRRLCLFTFEIVGRRTGSLVKRFLFSVSH